MLKIEKDLSRSRKLAKLGIPPTQIGSAHQQFNLNDLDLMQNALYGIKQRTRAPTSSGPISATLS